MKNLIFLSAFISILCLTHAEVTAQLRPIAVIEGVLDVHDVPDSSSIYIGQNAGVNANSAIKNNTTLGTNAGARIGSGSQNTLVGSDAGKSLIRGYHNTYIGRQAGAKDSTSFFNTFIGSDAGLVFTSGSYNTFIGYFAGSDLKDGTFNTFLGASSGDRLENGFGNVFIGTQSGPIIPSDVSNVLHIDVGLTPNPLIYGEFDNDLLRINGELQVETGSVNILDIGSTNDSAGYYWSEEDDQNAFGIIYDGVGSSGNNKLHLREFFGTHGNMVTFKGDGSVGIGQTNPEVQLHVDGGADVNIAGGGYILTGKPSARNIAIDDDEIMARNNGITSPLYLNFEGSPVHVGESIGIDIGTEVPTAELDVNGNARFRNIPALSSTMDVRIDNSGFLTTSSSDRRLKKNILTIENAVEKVVQLRGVVFNWKDDPTHQLKHGLIAQEVQEVLPELVFENDGYLGVNYSEMAGLFVEAIKDLKAENELLKSQYQDILIQLNQMQQVLVPKVPISEDTDLRRSK